MTRIDKSLNLFIHKIAITDKYLHRKCGFSGLYPCVIVICTFYLIYILKEKHYYYYYYYFKQLSELRQCDVNQISSPTSSKPMKNNTEFVCTLLTGSLNYIDLNGKCL